MMQRLCSWAIAIGVVAAATWGSPAAAQQAFKSADEAANALIAAVRAGDAKTIAQVLGPDASEITSSGDKVQDDNTRKELLAAYDAKHSLTKDATGRTFLTVGTDDFPIAIPIVEKDGTWRFDTMAGQQEILYRRIGRNELAAIQASLAYVDAQNDYAEMAPNGSWRLRTAHRQPSWQEGWALLAGRAGRAGKPARRGGRGGDLTRLSCQRRSGAVPWLLFQGADTAGRRLRLAARSTMSLKAR